MIYKRRMTNDRRPGYTISGVENRGAIVTGRLSSVNDQEGSHYDRFPHRA
jgi:hypothetical protein